MELQTPLRDRFLAGMASAAATVNVVTTDGPAGRHGLTVSAMASVSADTPHPTLLICVHHASPAAQAIRDNGVFCVNVLRDDQSYISDCFAGRFRTADGDKFSCGRWVREVTGAPRVVDPLVAFDCHLVQDLRVGTHHVFFGEVAALFLGSADASGSPLIYANRAYGTAARHDVRMVEPTRHEALRIGAVNLVGPFVLPRLIDSLKQAGHAVDLQLLEGDQRRISEGLQAGEIDGALVFDLDLTDTLAKDPIVSLWPHVVLAVDHPFAQRASLSLADLAPAPLVLLDAPPIGSYVTDLFETAGLQPTIHLRTQSVELVRGFVGHGLGYGLLVTRPAGTLAYDGRPLTTRPLSDPVTPCRLVLARRHDPAIKPVMSLFRAACLDLFAASRLE